jgi:hypothetical protein
MKMADRSDDTDLPSGPRDLLFLLSKRWASQFQLRNPIGLILAPIRAVCPIEPGELVRHIPARPAVATDLGHRLV